MNHPGFHQINQRRWSPYDAQAWDDFFAEWGAFMAPRLQAIAALIWQLRELKELDFERGTDDDQAA